jgi:dolichol-phosphate mannosyltransferase
MLPPFSGFSAPRLLPILRPAAPSDKRRLVSNAVPLATAPVPAGRPRRKVYIVLPAYNEEPNLPILFDALRETMEDNFIAYEVIIVDDGSQDRTAAVAREWAEQIPVVLVQHQVNQGLGATLRDGLLAALDRATDRDVIITMDADATHTPGLIVRMVRMIGEGYDVLIASRYQTGSRVYGVPFLRRVMSRLASMLMRTVFPIQGVKDFTCGYRAYRADALRKAVNLYKGEFVNQEGFQCMLDVLLKLRPMDLIFGEVPMLLRYDLKGGASKMRIWHTAKNSLLLLVQRRFGY